MAQKIVGLDIGSYSIKAAILETSFKGWELVGFEAMRRSAGEYVQAEKMLSDTPVSDEDVEERDASRDGEEPAQEQSKEGDSVTQAEEAPEMGHELQLSIQKMIQRYGADWETLYTAFDGDRISLKMLEVPFTDRRIIDTTLQHTLEDYIPFSLEGKVTDYGILGREDDNTRILVGMLDRNYMASYLEAFKASGKEPRGVTLDGEALAHLFEQLTPESTTGVQALIDIGHRKTTICILHNRRMDFIRTIPVGGQNLTRALRDDLGVSFDEAERIKHYKGFLPSKERQPENGEESRISGILNDAAQALLHEIKLTFQAYVAKTRRRVEIIKLVGGTSRLDNICAYIAEKMNIPCEPFRYLSPEFCRLGQGEDVEPVIAGSLGLALAAISGNKKEQINFRKGDFAFKGDFEFWKGRLLHIALSLAMILIFFSINIWSQFHVMGSERDVIEQRLLKTCSDTLKAEIGDPKICISRMMEIINKGDSGGGFIPSKSLLTIYDELVARLGMIETPVDLKELELTRKKIKLKGEVDSIPTVGLLVENLKTYDECFRSVIQGPTRSNVRGDRIEFSVDIVVDCEQTSKSGKRKKTESEAPKAAAESAAPPVVPAADAQQAGGTAPAELPPAATPSPETATPPPVMLQQQSPTAPGVPAETEGGR